MSDDAPPERPTQRPASLRTRAAVAESPLNRPVQGGETVDELADDEKLSRVVANYIGTHMLNIVKDLVAQPDPHAHYPVILSVFHLMNNHQLLADYAMKRPLRFFTSFDRELRRMQEKICNESAETELSVKDHCHTRLEPCFLKYITLNTVPQASDYGRLVNFVGTVVRTGQVKLLEYERKMQCTKCKFTFSIFSDLEQRNAFPKLESCPNKLRQCAGKTFVLVDGMSLCRDFQDIRLQERVEHVGVGSIPRSVLAILQDDLVDSLQAGDNVHVTGIPMRRWRSLIPGQKADVETFILANNILVTNSLRQQVQLTADLQAEFEQHWRIHAHTPIKGRDAILKAVCPQIYGMALVKLALILVLIGGVPRREKDGMKVRSQSHLLLVGDPGTGKSQFLKYAARLSTRSVLTTGVGTTSAGLTVAAVKDHGGDWMLEAGALVLADGGVCLIDEFNSISSHDRQAIHEAMEQQTISVAKAGLVCKLNTRCAVIAATNPKGRFDLEQSLTVNTSLASPLISRFDLILVLLDKRNDEWDEQVSAFVLQEQSRSVKTGPAAAAEPAWPMEKLKLYINYVRSRFEPQLSQDAERVLVTYFQRQRAADSRNAARTTIRLLESLIRVAQAHARLMFRETVEICDAVIAIALIDSSNQNQPILRELQAITQSTFPDDPDAVYAKQEQIVLRNLGLLQGAAPSSQPPPAAAFFDDAQQQQQQDDFQVQPLAFPPQQPSFTPPLPAAARSQQRSGSARAVVDLTMDDAPSAESRDFALHSQLSNERWLQTHQELSSTLPINSDAMPPPSFSIAPTALQPSGATPSQSRRVAFGDLPAKGSITPARRRASPDETSPTIPAAAATAVRKQPLNEYSPPSGTTTTTTTAAQAPTMLDNLDALDVSDILPPPVAADEAATHLRAKRGKFLED